MPKFAKRHYESIAESMQEALTYAECKNVPMLVNGVNVAIRELADLFARDNSRFSRTRFEAACVPGANVRARTRYTVPESAYEKALGKDRGAGVYNSRVYNPD